MLAFSDMQSCASNKLVILRNMFESLSCKASKLTKKASCCYCDKVVAGSVQCVWFHECLCWWQSLPQVLR